MKKMKNFFMMNAVILPYSSVFLDFEKYTVKAALSISSSYTHVELIKAAAHFTCKYTLNTRIDEY
jgi:hypothetical protein